MRSQLRTNVLVPQGRVSSVVFLVLPFLIWLFQFLQRRVLMFMIPSWWRLFCFILCGVERQNWKH